MSLKDVERGEVVPVSDHGPAAGLPKAVLGAGLKALFAAASGLTLTCGLGLLLWAITPSSGSGPVPLVRAGVTAFAAANGMTVTIGRSALTIPPLMITLIAVALLTGVSGRGRVVVSDRTKELVSTVTAAAVYAVVVVETGVGLGSPGAVTVSQWWRPALLALVVIGVTTLVRGDGWRPYLIDLLPDWVPVSVRLAAAATAAVIGGGAVTLLIGLVRSFGDANTVQTLAAPGAAGGFGMALLGIAYLPNAVLAGAGYATGVGFTIGGGVYSPFGSSPVELPAMPLLAAAPDGRAVSGPTLALLLLPTLAAVLIGRGAVRRLGRRQDRLLAAAGAAVLAGVALALIAAVASGGVAGGAWASSGVPPVVFGAVVAAGLGAVGTAVAGVARVPAPAAADQVEGTGLGGSADGVTVVDAVAGGETAGDETAGGEAVGDGTVGDGTAGYGTGEETVGVEPEPEPEAEAVTGSKDSADDPQADDPQADAPQAGQSQLGVLGGAEIGPVVRPVDEPDLTDDRSQQGPADQAAAGQPRPEGRDDTQAVDNHPDDHPREEDRLGEANPETDDELIAGLARPSAPRQTG